MLWKILLILLFSLLTFFPQENSAQTITIEAESLANSAVTNTNVGEQNMSSFGSGWSQGKQLFWQANQINDYATLFVEVTTPGTYNISLTPTLAPDYGIVKAFQVIPGKPLFPLGGEINGYSTKVEIGKNINLGSTYLVEGKNQLTLYVVGKSNASSGYYFGIDNIKLTSGKVGSDPLPDLQISDEVYINNIKYNLEDVITLESEGAINKSNGRCAFPINYFIENNSPINIDKSFQSSLKVSETSSSSVNINSISANEKRKVDASLWLEPGTEKKIYLQIDTKNNIDESSEENNNSAIIITLNGDCGDAPVGVVVLNKETEDNDFKVMPGTFETKPTDKKYLERPNIEYTKKSDSDSIETFQKLDNPDLILIVANPMTKNITVINQGQTATEVSSKILVNCEYTSFDGSKKPCKNTTKLEEISFPVLQPGQQKTLTISNFNFSNLDPGKYSFELIADSTNSIEESDESNNKTSGKLRIEPTPPPPTPVPTPSPPPVSGKTVFNSECAHCHDTGQQSIPQLGDSPEWQKRKTARGGFKGLVNSAKNGYNEGSMPSFKDVLTNEEITKSVKYLCNCN